MIDPKIIKQMIKNKEVIPIWYPRYHDGVVLVGKKHVKNGINKIVFTKAKHLMGKIFELTGEFIRNCPLDSNGKIACYAIPLEEFSL